MRLKSGLVHILYLCCFSISNTQAQTYPSGIQTSFVGPKTLFLDEYSDPFQPKIRATILFTDFSVQQWNFSLRLKITGPNGLLIQTKPGVRPIEPVTVMPGKPYVLEGADLQFYFDFNNLLFTGLSRTQLEQNNNRLPEGLYTFCFEVIDHESMKAVSHPGCVSAYLSLNDPPLVLLPVKGSVVENISMQNILLQWQLSNPTGNLNVSDLRYQVDLYEVNNSWSNPQTAILNNQALPVWQSPPLQHNSYLYSNTDPLLEKGKRYVFTVRAFPLTGRSSFKNNGYSMPCYFHYGYFENDTVDIIKPENEFQFALSTPSVFKWKKPRKALTTQLVTYTLRLCEIQNNQTAEAAIVNNVPFYQQSYLPNADPAIEKTIPVFFWTNVKRMGRYAWQVTAQSGTQIIARSPVHQFLGPPPIENFIAGGFLMTITRLTSWDTLNHIASGRCKTMLSYSPQKTCEFAFSNIQLSLVGNNEWAMSAGSIADKACELSYTFQPKEHPENGPAIFTADSIFVSSVNLKLGGSLSWDFPLPGSSMQIEQVKTKKYRLTLANSTFLLNSNEAMFLNASHNIPLMEPMGFVYKLAQASEFHVYQNTYEFFFKGFVQLPSMVKTNLGAAAHVAFRQTQQVHYIEQENNEQSEALRLAENLKFGLLPYSYTIDLSEKKSPGEFSSDTLWKGIVVGKALLELPKAPELSGQLTLPLARTLTVSNTPADSNEMYITHRGLDLRARFNFEHADSVKFNKFVSRNGYLKTKIRESELEEVSVNGSIQIPVIDTAQLFPYKIPVDERGFGEGYLLNGLANTTFTFNPAGGQEQKIKMFIKRAVFKGKDHLEIDMDLEWPHFSLDVKGIQRFCVWGNNNIGFDIPNGKSALSYQSSGKASNFDIMVDYLGCGRNGNAYAFGASAKINMDEEISGETGPPVVNAYSIYKNPLLSGLVFIPGNQVAIPTGTGSAASSPTVSQSVAAYSNAIATGIGDALSNLGATAADSNIVGPSAINSSEPLLSANVVTQLKQVLDIVYRLKPFIKDQGVTEKDWMVLERFRQMLETDVVQQSQLTNARGVLNFVLTKVVEALVNELNQPIQDISDKAVGKIRLAINDNVIEPINGKVKTTLGDLFDKMEARIAAQVDPQYHNALHLAVDIVEASVVKTIQNSVAGSFEDNITSKISGFVQMGVTAKVKAHVRSEVTSAGQKLISSGANASISLNEMLKNSGALFVDIADTVKDVMMRMNGANLLNTAESLVEDAIKGINWTNISNQLMNELVKKGLPNALASQASQVFGANAGPYIGAVLSTVQFDFSNIGEKLKNGEFDKIVKFDPTTIYIESPAVDVRGTLIFRKGDPVYGDCWQAEVLARVKVPKKDNPIECSAFFLNGKTSQQQQSFTYWFVKLGVMGLNIPLNPSPVIWDGAEGFAFSKMKKTGPTLVVPDNSNKFGVGCKFYFYDQPSSGKSYIFALGAEAVFNQEGFAIQLNGDASVMNYQKTSAGRYKSPGFVTGTGVLGYYKTPEVSKIAGNFTVKLNTEPIICAGGDVGLDLRSPTDWKAWVGTQQHPIGVKILCKDFLSNTAFMEIGNAGFKTGLNMNVAIAARSPWIQVNSIKVRGFSDLAFGYSAYASLEWDPAFRIDEASISAWLSANLGIEYQTSVSTGSLNLAGVSLAGTLLYKSNPDSEIHGSMSGSITVLGYNIGFETPVHYSLSRKEILN